MIVDSVASSEDGQREHAVHGPLPSSRGTDLPLPLRDPQAATSSGLPITIRGLSKSYGPVHALDGIDLDIRAGEFVTLLGPSGSGKTTLLMALAGFIRPTAGSIRFGGREVVTLQPHKRNVGVVFQSYALFPHMNVSRNVGYALRVRGVPAAEIGRRVHEALSLVRLGELADRHIHQLSGGQKQRVALARAIVFHPSILLMDEPLSALDKNLREEMQIEIRQLQRHLGITTVSVTHDQREALTMADRVAVLNHGRLAQVDSPERLYSAPANSFVAGFVGESTLLDTEISSGVAYLFGQPLKTRHPVPRGAARSYLVFRAEKIEIRQASEPGDYNTFTGRVRDVVFQGDTILIYVVLKDGRTVTIRRPSARAGHGAALQVGLEIVIGLHAEDTLIVPDE